MSDERLVDYVEAGRLLGVPAGTVKYLCDSHQLPYMLVAGKRRIAVADIQRCLEQWRHGTFEPNPAESSPT